MSSSRPSVHLACRPNLSPTLAVSCDQPPAAASPIPRRQGLGGRGGVWGRGRGAVHFPHLLPFLLPPGGLPPRAPLPPRLSTTRILASSSREKALPHRLEETGGWVFRNELCDALSYFTP